MRWLAVIGFAALVGCAGRERVFVPGGDVTTPELVQSVRPQYTPEAMLRRIQGDVALECVVQPDGSVSAVRIVKSLDPTHGLDAEAVRTLSQWRYKPGTRHGRPVPVKVRANVTFTLR